MNLREPEKQILDDFEHKVTGKMTKFGDRPDFPKLENYGIDRQDFDGYLFDCQAIMDMGGSKRSQLTVGGFITVLPVLILSAFPDKAPIWTYGTMITTIIAICIGLVLALFVKSLLQAVIHYRLSKHKDMKMEAFIKAVLFYEPKGGE